MNFFRKKDDWIERHSNGRLLLLIQDLKSVQVSIDKLNHVQHTVYSEYNKLHRYDVKYKRLLETMT